MSAAFLLLCIFARRIDSSTPTLQSSKVHNVCASIGSAKHFKVLTIDMTLPIP